MMISPSRSFAAPYFTSATPAASASFTTCTARPMTSENSLSASVPIQPLSMFAAEKTVPLRTIAGTVMPMGLSPVRSLKCSATSPTTFATASGVDGFGVSIRSRSAANSPVARSTGAPLMPEPPMSIPSG